MKGHWEFPLDKYQASNFFSAIRDKKDVLKIWMNAIKIIISKTESSKEDSVATMHLYVDKMSRVFFVSKDKYFSLCFPFFVSEIKIEPSSSILTFGTASCSLIDNFITSEILSLINLSSIDSDNCYEFIDPIIESCETHEYIWGLLRELIICEDGYIRYDYDISNFNGDYHPINHLDICYRNGNSYKIGIDEKIMFPYFLDILDVTTKCTFLYKKPT